MGAATSQCCVDCSENSRQEFIEASPSSHPDEGLVLGAEAAVRLRPAPGEEVRAAAKNGAARAGLSATSATSPCTADVVAFGGAGRCEPAAPDTARTEGSFYAGSSSSSTSTASSSSTATATPRGGARPDCAGVPPRVDAEAQESTEDLTEEPTLPPKEETLEVPIAVVAPSVVVVAACPATGGRSEEIGAPEGVAVEDGLTSRMETSEDPLQEALADGGCQLQVDFTTPQKEVIEEPPTPPTAVPESPAEPVQEAWADFVERSCSRLREAGISDEPSALFEVFQTTEDLGLTFASFARLYTLATERVADSDAATEQPPWAGPAEAPGRSWRFPYQPIQRLLGSHWKAQKLWRLLSERTSRPEYAEAPCSRGRLEGRRCLVVGAGPCGLRAAIEMRLLGAQVTVVEQRTRFTRINQLHIWSWCGEDLKGLGARIIEPPPKDFGSNPDLLAIAINDLQKLLLKVALLLGADVRLGLSYNGVHWEAGAWQADLGVASGMLGNEGRAGAETPGMALASFGAPGDLPPSPLAPGPLRGVAAVLGAGGFASSVGEEVGMKMLETESLRKETAIGLICNVARSHGKAEADLRSYAMARQFYTSTFKRAAEETGADLENIVYVKAPTSHYFVMTPTPKSLIATGVVIDEAHKPMLDRDNINGEKLDALVRRVLSYRFKQGEPTVMEAVGKDLGGDGRLVGYADSGPRLFDFSKMRRSSEGVVFLPPATGQGEGGEASHLLVSLAGDALIEPFWPEGLGIVRGFFSVLDTCYAVQQWSNGATCAATQEIYQTAFQQLKTLSAATRARVLREDERKFALAPNSRYR